MLAPVPRPLWNPREGFLGGRAPGGLAGGLGGGLDAVLERGRGRGVTSLIAGVSDARWLASRLGLGSFLARGRAPGLALGPAAGLGRLGRRLFAGFSGVRAESALRALVVIVLR